MYSYYIPQRRNDHYSAYSDNSESDISKAFVIGWFSTIISMVLIFNIYSDNSKTSGLAFCGFTVVLFCCCGSIDHLRRKHRDERQLGVGGSTLDERSEKFIEEVKLLRDAEDENNSRKSRGEHIDTAERSRSRAHSV